MSNSQSTPSLPYDSTPFLYARDESHLNLLATFHYVGGGLTLLMALFPSIYIVLGIVMLSGKLNTNNPRSAPPPPEAVGWVFIAFGALFMLLGLGLGILIIYSGLCIKGRRNWIFSLVIAGFMCLSVPLGTALGVFTFIVLLRDSVKRLYGLPTPPPYPAPPPY